MTEDEMRDTLWNIAKHVRGIVKISTKRLTYGILYAIMVPQGAAQWRISYRAKTQSESLFSAGWQPLPSAARGSIGYALGWIK